MTVLLAHTVVDCSSRKPDTEVFRKVEVVTEVAGEGLDVVVGVNGGLVVAVAHPVSANFRSWAMARATQMLCILVVTEKV